MTDLPPIIPGVSELPNPYARRQSATSVMARERARPAIDQRRPRDTVLPLREVDMDIYLSADDLSGDSITWPPNRFQERDKRLLLQHQVALGDFTGFVDKRSLLISFNFVGSYLDTLRAVLLSQEPGQSFEPEFRSELQRAMENAINDMERHGRTILLYSGDVLECPDVTTAYPMDDGSWVFVEPFISPETNVVQADKVRIKEWIPSDEDGIDGVLFSEIRNWSPKSIRDTVAVLPAIPTRLKVVDAPPSRGWGTAKIDSLIPIALEMNRRINWHSYAYDLTDVPTLELRANSDDTRNRAAGIDQPIDPDSMETAVVEAYKAYPDHDVWALGDGTLESSWLQATIDSSGWSVFMNILSQRWSDETGVPPTEAADSADVSSGAAIARRFQKLILFARSKHSVLRDAMSEILGTEVDWPLPQADEGLSAGTDATEQEPAPTGTNNPPTEDNPNA